MILRSGRKGLFAVSEAAGIYPRPVVCGKRSRDEVMAYFSSLFHKLDRRPSQAWNGLVSACADLCPDEVVEEIRQAYEDELVEPGYIGWKDTELNLKWGGMIPVRAGAEKSSRSAVGVKESGLEIRPPIGSPQPPAPSPQPTVLARLRGRVAESAQSGDGSNTRAGSGGNRRRKARGPALRAGSLPFYGRARVGRSRQKRC